MSRYSDDDNDVDEEENDGETEEDDDEVLIYNSEGEEYAYLASVDFRHERGKRPATKKNKIETTITPEGAMLLQMAYNAHAQIMATTTTTTTTTTTQPTTTKEEIKKDKEVVVAEKPPKKKIKREPRPISCSSSSSSSTTTTFAPNCPVCEERRYPHEYVICPFTNPHTKAKCDHVICRPCMRKWIENTPFHLEPNCMECNSIFSRSYIAQAAGKTWVNVNYAKVRQRMLFDRVQARFPDVRSRLEAKARLDKWIIETRTKMNHCFMKLKSIIDHSRNEYIGAMSLFEQVYNDYANNRRADIPEYLQSLPIGLDLTDIFKTVDQAEWKDIQQRESGEENNDRPLKIGNILVDDKGAVSVTFPSGDTETCEAIRTQDVALRKRKKSAPQMRMNCPKIGCKGVISSDWMCNTCHCGICSDCHIEYDRGTPPLIGTSASGAVVEIPLADLKKAHKCKEEDVEMATYLKSKTKPCPQCHSLIEKSVGCNQMWCINCQTAFDWRSLQVLTVKHIHNPEYDDFLQKRGLHSKRQRDLHEAAREQERRGLLPPVTPCDVTLLMIDMELGPFQKQLSEIGAGWFSYFNLTAWVRQALHFLDEDRHTHQAERLRQDDFPDIKEYLEEKITEDVLKIKIQRREKANSKLLEIIAIEHTWSETVLELVAEFINIWRKGEKHELKEIWKMLVENQTIANEALANVARTYNSKPHVIR